MDNISTSWQNLMASAGIKDFRFHDLRHDFASQLAMKGIDLYRIKDLLGHSTIQLTERYSHLSDEALAEAVEVLA
jgi:site-specific recombinase XerD